MVNITKPGRLREIDRLNVFDGIIKMYEDKPESVVLEYPIWMKFAGEAGIDEGGVQRDMYTAFWDDCYSLLFEGATTLVPMVHPRIDLSQFVTIGRVISHGYLATGILPDRIALPVLISAVCGLDVTIPEHVCDRAREKGPIGHKPHLIIKLLISWVLHNRIMLCKL